jgi:hypothetical protein
MRARSFLAGSALDSLARREKPPKRLPNSDGDMTIKTATKIHTQRIDVAEAP